MDYHFEFNGFNWFHLSAPWISFRKTHIKLWNLFNKKSTQGRYWGIGFLQVNTWHFLYIGDMGFRFCKHANA